LIHLPIDVCSGNRHIRHSINLNISKSYLDYWGDVHERIFLEMLKVSAQQWIGRLGNSLIMLWLYASAAAKFLMYVKKVAKMIKWLAKTIREQ
jgi:hypothetical protein